MKYALRWYQREAVDSIFHYFQSGKTGNPIVALPTGTGKSVVIGAFVKEACQTYPGTRILMLTHRKELIGQNAKKLESLWPSVPLGVYSAGLKRKEVGRPVTFAGIQSVVKKPNLFFPVDLAIVDECHLISNKETTGYRKFLEAGLKTNPYLKVIGLTATPYRHGMGDLTLGGIFTDRCYDLTGKEEFNRLLAEGYLCRLIPRQTETELSAEGVALRDGDYVEKELQEAVDRPDVTSSAVRELVRMGVNRKHWLIFSSGVKHAHHIKAELDKYGVTSIVITGETDNREQALDDAIASKYQAIINNNVLTTGFDFPGIDLIGCLRPTQSASLWVQMLGRGTRPEEGKRDCLVLDFARNTARLGPINDPVLPSMKRKKNDEESGKVPVKICPSCAAYNHTRAAICIECGQEFPPPENDLRQVASSQELIAGIPPMPIVETFKVNSVTYSIHRKRDKPPSMKVHYNCCSGYREFHEYVCVQHEGFAKVNARRWWEKRTRCPFPETVEDALLATPYLARPTHITVHVNLDHPKVLSHEFSGPD